jgi:hypothetical protein
MTKTNTIDLRTCKPGQKLKSVHGLTLTYVEYKPELAYPHIVKYPVGKGFGSRLDNGKTFHKGQPEDHDIVKILPMKTKLFKPNSTTIRTVELPNGTCEVEIQVIGSRGQSLKFEVPQFHLENKSYRFNRWDENKNVSVYVPAKD